MEEYKRCHVPAFGSWDYTDDLPFSQCFETARHAAGLLRYGYSDHDSDLYVAGDLYENDVITPAVIVVPRIRRRTKRRYPHIKEAEKQMKGWGYERKRSPTRVELRYSSSSPTPLPAPPAVARGVPKAVDEDLYKIPPELLYAEVPKRKRGFGLLSSCLMPVCA